MKRRIIHIETFSSIWDIKYWDRTINVSYSSVSKFQLNTRNHSRQLLFPDEMNFKQFDDQYRCINLDPWEKFFYYLQVHIKKGIKWKNHHYVNV